MLLASNKKRNFKATEKNNTAAYGNASENQPRQAPLWLKTIKTDKTETQAHINKTNPR